MSDTLELWLIRHGETTWNASGRIQGYSDVALSPLGIAQAKSLAARIGQESFDGIYSSDLKRAYLTAQTVFPYAPIKQDKRLREFNFGIFEGKTWKALSEAERKQMSVWFLGPYDKKLPEGESNDDLRGRVAEFISHLPTSGRVIAFTHGGTIAALTQLITGRPEVTPWNKAGSWGFRFANTSITKLAFSQLYKAVLSLNDAAHLESLESWPNKSK